MNKVKRGGDFDHKDIPGINAVSVNFDQLIKPTEAELEDESGRFTAQEIESAYYDACKTSLRRIFFTLGHVGDIVFDVKGDGIVIDGKNKQLVDAVVVILEQYLKTSRVVDLEEAKKLLEMKNEVNRDPLTNFLNRRGLGEVFPRECHKAKEGEDQSGVGVLLVDVDFFKRVNDTYGLTAGDAVITSLSKKIKNVLRPSDVVCRYGGEEFMVVISNITRENLEKVANKIHEATTGEYVFFDKDNNEVKMKLSTSLGATFLSKDEVVQAKNARDLLGRAVREVNMAESFSKENGRDQVNYFDQINTEEKRGLRTLEDFRREYYQTETTARRINTLKVAIDALPVGDKMRSDRERALGSFIKSVEALIANNYEQYLLNVLEIRRREKEEAAEGASRIKAIDRDIETIQKELESLVLTDK